MRHSNYLGYSQFTDSATPCLPIGENIGPCVNEKKRRIITKPRYDICFNHFSAYCLRPTLKNAYSQIRKLNDLDFSEDGIHKPTTWAGRTAWGLICDAYSELVDRFPEPYIAPDGDGGIIIDWEKGSGKERRLASLIIPASDLRRPYLYYKSQHGSEVERNLTGKAIAERLKWLVS